MLPTPDEFEAWRDHPITQWVLSGVAGYADRQREAWAAATWASGLADQEALTRCRVRADAYEGLAALTYEQACGLRDEEPDDDPA